MKKLFLLSLIILFGNLKSCEIENPSCETGNQFTESYLFSNDINEVQKAITGGADVNGKSCEGYTPLMQTASKNRLETAKLLIDKGANVDSQDDYGKTALIRAASLNKLEMVKLLIKSGAKLNFQDEIGTTALQYAVMFNRPEMAKLLIDAGANLNIKDNNGETPLMRAGKNDFIEIIKLIKERMETVSELIKVAQDGDAEQFEQLIAQGVNINSHDEDGFTALMRAAQGSINPEQAEKKLKIIEILLDKKADFTLKDNVMHYTALKWAQESGNTQAEKLLKNAGATE